MDSDAELAIVRRAYAKQIMAAAMVDDERVEAAELLQRGGQIQLPPRHQDAQCDRARQLTAVILYRGLGPMSRMDRFTRVIEEDLAGGGEYDLAFGAVEERDT